MSKRYKAKVNLAKSVLSCMGCPSKYKDEDLSTRDAETARDAIYLWSLLLVDKCICSLEKGDETSILGLQGRVIQIVSLVPNVDLFAFLQSLDLASQYLLDTTTGDKPMSYTRFKHEVVSSCQGPVQTEMFRILLGLVKRLCRRWFSLSDEAAFRDLRAIFCFLLRLSLKDVESLKETALDTWFETEMNKDWNRDYTGPEREVISEWFPIEDTAIIAELYAPKHGAGSTFERVKSPFEKAQLNEVPQLVQDVETCLGFEYWTDRNVLMASPTSEMYQAYVESDPEAHYHLVTTVPKNWKTYRIISMEEIGLMFAQQGAMVAIFDYLKAGYSSFAKHYCVNTEDRNRALAQLGSENGMYATIDSSAASDNIAYRLVDDWFSESCLSYLVSLRSKYAVFRDTEYKNMKLNDVYEVSKFAPMGSALCFPIECICFGAVVESILRKHFGRNHNKIWFVYGDDLVVPVEIVDDLIARFNQLGWKINVSKSYYNVRDEKSQNLFRESCGGEYLNGIDVTPPRIPRKFEGLYFGGAQSFDELTDARRHAIAKLVELANDLFEHSPTARWALVYRLLDESQLHLPIYVDATGEKGLRSNSPTNAHLKRVINTRSQQVCVLCWQLRLKRKSLDLFEAEKRQFSYWENVDMGYCFVPKYGRKQHTPVPASSKIPKMLVKRILKKRHTIDNTPELAERARTYRKNHDIDNDLMNKHMHGLGPVLLYEYLRLAQRKNRQHLLDPEEAVEVLMDPRLYEMSISKAFIPDESDYRVITDLQGWSYSSWNSDELWSGANCETVLSTATR